MGEGYSGIELSLEEIDSRRAYAVDPSFAVEDDEVEAGDGPVVQLDEAMVQLVKEFNVRQFDCLEAGHLCGEELKARLAHDQTDLGWVSSVELQRGVDTDLLARWWERAGGLS